MIYILGVCLAMVLAGCGRQFTVIKAELQPSKATVGQSESASQVSAELEDAVREGLILFRQGDLKGALRQFHKAHLMDSADWEPPYYLGLTYYRQEDCRLAVQYLHISLDLAPGEKRTRSLVYAALAETYEALGELGKAELHFRTALNLNPDLDRAASGLHRLHGRAERGPK